MGGKNHGKVADEKRKYLPAVAMAGEVQGWYNAADEHGGGDGDGEVRWASHYSSSQEILLVGDGDFSFSLSLARSFRSASNIVATSLDNYSEVTSKYRMAKSNIGRLKKMGASVLHGIDTTQMKHHKDLKMRKFDRIIFNFPHAGFKGKEHDLRLINKHKKLVYGFFRNASHMIRRDGEIHISHKTSHPFCEWKLEELASQSSLVLLKCVDFKIRDYPGYNNKRGDGSRCDQPFRLGECCTYMFQVGKPPRRKRPAANVAHLGGMVFSTPLPRRGSKFVPIESDGYVLWDRQRPPSFVPNYYRMLYYAGSPEGNQSRSPIGIATGGHIFLSSTEGGPYFVPDLRVMSFSPDLPERNLHGVSIASDASLPLRTAGYRRDESSWPAWPDRESPSGPGRYLHPNCLPIGPGGRLFFSSTEGGPNCVPDLPVMSPSPDLPERNLHCVSIASDASLPLRTAGYRRDVSSWPAWPDRESPPGPGRPLHPHCLPIGSGGCLFLSSTEGGPNCVPDLRVMTSSSPGWPERASRGFPFASDANLLPCTQRPPATGYRRDANDQPAWSDEEGFTGRSLLRTRHQYLGYATGLEERTRLRSVSSGRFHGGLLQSRSTRPVRKQVHEASSGRTLHSSNVRRVDWPRRRRLRRQSP